MCSKYKKNNISNSHPPNGQNDTFLSHFGIHSGMLWKAILCVGGLPDSIKKYIKHMNTQNTQTVSKVVSPGLKLLGFFAFLGGPVGYLGPEGVPRPPLMSKNTSSNTNIKIPKPPQMPKLMQNTDKNDPETIKMRLQLVKPNADNLRQNSSYEMPSLTLCLRNAFTHPVPVSVQINRLCSRSIGDM